MTGRAITSRTLTAAAAAAACVSLAACGGSSKAPSAPKVSKADFIKRADLVCDSTDKLRAALTPPRFKGSTPQAGDLPAVSIYLARLQAVFDGEVRLLHGIAEPNEASAVLDKMLANFDAVAKGVAGAHRAARLGYLQAFKDTFANSQAAGTEANKLAHQYGFKVCGAG